MGRHKIRTSQGQEPQTVMKQREKMLLRKSVWHSKSHRAPLKMTLSWHSLGIPDTSFRGRNTRTARRVRRSKSVPAVAKILIVKAKRGAKDEIKCKFLYPNHRQVLCKNSKCSNCFKLCTCDYIRNCIHWKSSVQMLLQSCWALLSL